MILETCVLPIEYDEKTKEKAKRIKKVLEKNPDFFRVFLKGDKISLIDENSTIYIEKGQSILKYLDGISPKYATGFLKDKYVDNPEEVLFYWTSRFYEIGIYKNKENKLRKLCGICDYFHTNEDYEGLYNYLHASEEEQQEIEEDVFIWLEKTYRYHLINYLLTEQLPFLQNNLFSPFEIDMETGILDILELSQKLLDMLESSEELEEEITYPMSRQETIMLFREFLIDIDPTLELLYKEIEMEFNGALVTSPRNRKVKNIQYIQENPDGAVKTNPSSQKPVVYVPWKYTLEDIFALTHEFFHYIEEDNNIYPYYSPQQELATIFFETLLKDYLRKKSYPEEEVEKYYRNRRIDTANNAFELNNFMLLLNNIINNIPISPAIEFDSLDSEDQELVEEMTPFMQDKYIDSICDEQNSSLIDETGYIIENFLYAYGYYYADIALKKLHEGEDMIPKMIDLAKNVNARLPKDALRMAGLIPKEQEYRKMITNDSKN